MIKDPLYNPLDTATLRDPYPVYDELRSAHPVYWHEQLQSWLVTRYDDCKNVLSDHETFARDRRRVGEQASEDKISVQSMDPPTTVPLRRLFFTALKALDMPEIGARARRQIEHQLDAAPRSEFDLMALVAEPLADKLTCLAFGVESPGPGVFARLAYGIALAMDSGLAPSQRSAGAQASDELRTLVRGWIQRAEHPPGLIGSIATAPEMRDAWPEGVVVSTMAAMVNAAWSTIYASTGNAVLTLIEHPDARAAITVQNLETAVDELVRFDSPAHATARVATCATRLGDIVIHRGQPVITLMAAANRDPARFPSPNRLVLDRAPNPHLGFGWGPHVCIGASLALAILREVVAAVVARPALLLAAEPRRYCTATLRYLEVLPVSHTCATEKAS